MSSRPEVLAPAGSPEALAAALRCGADAVYLGASAFNARRNAHNFDEEALARAVADCHLRGAKLHLTLNTLIRADELTDAMALAEHACALGVDALIVQDMGLARLLHAAAPTMPLHASTQLSCHTPAGVRELRDCGFSRVVLAREMSREEITACANLGCELEVFVHGALCMSVSGQCYLSAMLGGRSGNRGLCAQPCRLPFCPSGGAPARDNYGLSLRDLSLLAHVAELAEAGISSFKIEGRMKRPEYVAAATTLFAAAVRGEQAADISLQDLQSVFSRSGFTDGYYAKQRGAAMFGIRRKEDVEAAAPVLKRLRRLYDGETPRVPVSLSLRLAAGEPAALTACDRDGHTAMATGSIPEPALHQSPDPARVEQQLRKTGGTPFMVEQVTLSLEEGLYLPAAVLNALRREALENLSRLRSAPAPIPFSPAVPPVPQPQPPALPRLLARLASAAQWSPPLSEKALCFFPLSELRDIPESIDFGVEIPRAMFGQEADIRRLLAVAADRGARYALCGNIGALPLARETGLLPIGGFGLNLTNREAVAAYAACGLVAATLSMELTFRQLSFAADCPIPTGLLAYGRQPLMLTRNCPRRCGGGRCDDCRPEDGMADRRGIVFPTACSGAGTELLNTVPLYWADRLAELPPVDFLLLHFTTETAVEAAVLAESYRSGGSARDSITRGLYRRGVD